MKSVGKFLLLNQNEFSGWLNMQLVKRKIALIQQHHTYIPSYKHFDGTNHFKLCESMERSHKERGFDEIGQNFTTFPDGTIMVCRNMNIIPAGIKGANANGICIEHVGNFDKGNDTLSPAHQRTVVEVTRSLLTRFKLTASDQTVIYHHWYDLNTAKRIVKEGTGATKSCPGTAFFGGNTIEAFKANLLPLL
jgi:N-acetylmuramoyl-L-alanine amidase